MDTPHISTIWDHEDMELWAWDDADARWPWSLCHGFWGDRVASLVCVAPDSIMIAVGGWEYIEWEYE